MLTHHPYRSSDIVVRGQPRTWLKTFWLHVLIWWSGKWKMRFRRCHICGKGIAPMYRASVPLPKFRSTAPYSCGHTIHDRLLHRNLITPNRFVRIPINQEGRYFHREGDNIIELKNPFGIEPTGHGFGDPRLDFVDHSFAKKNVREVPLPPEPDSAPE